MPNRALSLRCSDGDVDVGLQLLRIRRLEDLIRHERGSVDFTAIRTLGSVRIEAGEEEMVAARRFLPTLDVRERRVVAFEIVERVVLANADMKRRLRWRFLWRSSVEGRKTEVWKKPAVSRRPWTVRVHPAPLLSGETHVARRKARRYVRMRQLSGQ